MPTDYAIHSPNDGKLLIRLHDELVRHGMKSDTDWNIRKNPGTGRYTLRVWYLHVSGDILMTYFNHECEGAHAHHDLTTENFQTVLNEVLQNFGIEYKPE